MAYIGAVPTSATFAIDTFNGDGSTVAFTLREAPLASSSILVFVGGVRQNTDTYNVSGTTLTFTEAPPSGTNNIQVLFLGLNASPSIPSDGSVTANKIVDGVITGAKLAAGSITGDKIGLTAINANNIVNATITGDKIATSQITGNLLTANCVTGNNIVSLGTPTSGTLANCTVDGTDSVGFRNVPINDESADYTLVLADAGKVIFHPSSDNNARTFTIPAASSVAYPIGTALTFINLAATASTIAITTDTMYLSSAGTTGSRTLAQYGSATAIKVSGLSSSGVWIISGSGLT